MPVPIPTNPPSPTPAPAPESLHPIMLYDGVCNLCNASVQWVIRHDPRAVFRFAALQSPIARQLLINTTIDPAALASVVLIDRDRVWTSSDAALEIAQRLGPPWSYARIFSPLPRSLRDAVYQLVARNRYRLFGRSPSCIIPTAALRSRFLDLDPPT